MIGLLIYLVGSVLAYRRMRKTWNREHGDKASWGSRVGMFFFRNV
jgi:hypothetical protein